MRRFLIGILFVALLAVSVSADWYTDGAWRQHDYWHYVEQPRYVGEPYNSDFEDMARRSLTGLEYPTPSTFYVSATGVEDAEIQLEVALQYAPLSIAITFDKVADARRFHEKYRDWRDSGTQIDALIGAVWTRTDSLFAVGRTGSCVVLTIEKYADGWLAYVDTSDLIRVYADAEYSRKLLDFRKLWIERITGTDEEKVETIANLVGGYAEYDNAENMRMRSNGFIVADETAHSVKGFVERRKVVCDGYTAAMQFALACHGIKAFEVILQSPRGNHAVNMVRVDGLWARVDATDGEYGTEYNVLMWIRRIYNG